MKDLAFITSEDFENFTSQLIGQELPNSAAIKGYGGDGGLDGLAGTTAFQMYFPDPKNRIRKKYIAKIDDSLIKLRKTIVNEGLEVANWFLVVPEDLDYKVVIYLQQKSKEVEINCSYWGATKLTALVASHPQIRDNFPEVLIPDVKTGVNEVKNNLIRMSIPRTEHNIEIISDQQYRDEREALRAELRAQYRSAQSLPGSAAVTASYAYREVMDKKFRELDTRKAASDRAYALDIADINDHFNELERDKQADLIKRNMLTSGTGQREIDDFLSRRIREIERLRMKYGKDGDVKLS